MSDEPGTKLEALYRAHGDRLWRAVLAYSGDPDVASDAVAEASAQALRRGSELRSPLHWVWRAAFRIAAGELKARRRTGGAVTERGYEMPEDAADLTSALARLSPKQRRAVVLHHYGGYPVKEIAEMIGSTSAAVKVHLSRGRRRLRELLEGPDG